MRDPSSPGTIEEPMTLRARRAAPTRPSSSSGRNRLISVTIVAMVELAASRIDSDAEGSLSTSTSSVSVSTLRDTCSLVLPSFSILATDAMKCIACIDLMHSETALRAARATSTRSACPPAMPGILWELETSNSAEMSLFKPPISVSREDREDPSKAAPVKRTNACARRLTWGINRDACSSSLIQKKGQQAHRVSTTRPYRESPRRIDPAFQYSGETRPMIKRCASFRISMST